jgi:hypothetical protein
MRYEKADANAADPGHRHPGVDQEEKEKTLHDNEDYQEMTKADIAFRRWKAFRSINGWEPTKSEEILWRIVNPARKERTACKRRQEISYQSRSAGNASTLSGSMQGTGCAD